MMRMAWVIGFAFWSALISGCVERRYVINSDPPGALVLRNGKPIGAAPADDHFPYYGNYHFTLVKDGFKTLQVDQKIRAPWYEFFPLDFVSETLLPCRIEDVRRFTFHLEPVEAVRPDELLNRGQGLRGRAQSISPAATAAKLPATGPTVPEAPPTLPPVADPF